jgi:hypothetical protein
MMLLFAVLMVAASFSMIRSKNGQEAVEEGAQKFNYPLIILEGALVGILTGLVGAGGGFLIIPTLVFFANLPMKQAVGTSLFIIFINSLIGFGGDLINGVNLNIQFLCIITTIALIGMFIGTQLSKKINGPKLKPLFGWFILVMGCYIIIHEVFLK